MSQPASEKIECKGQYAELLKEFVELMDRLWTDHRTSPTKASTEEFYAWGNLDYTVVMSAHRFSDLVEIKSKHGNLDIKKDEDGKLDCKINVDEKEAHKKGGSAAPPPNPTEILQKTARALNHYYYSKVR